MMQVILKDLVVFEGKNGVIGEKDGCWNWMKRLGFATPQVQQRIINANFHLPIDLETEFLERYKLPVKDIETLRILNRLINSDGIPLRQFTEKQLVNLICLEYELMLIRQDKSDKLYKPLPSAYNPEVKKLIGLNTANL